jgi:tetratricopeptide (TPR) repeat protein
MSIRTIVPIEQADWRISPVPDWVVAREPDWDFVPPAGHSLALLLIDEQHCAATHTASHRTVRRVATLAAVQALGQVELDFDPAAHRLLIHELAIWRRDADGLWQKRSLADRRHFLVRQREQQLEQQMLNGRVSVVALLEDLRMDDAIDLAWTLEPRDLLPGLRFTVFFGFVWSVPVARVFFTLHGTDAAPLKWLLHVPPGAAVPAETAEGASATWTLEHPGILVPEPNVPSGHWPFALLDVTAWSSWAEVAEYFACLWLDALADGAEAVAAEAARLRAGAADDEAAARAAIRLVQESVRYLAIDFGSGAGMLPNGAGTVLRRRFGDCKDKTVLLVALLRALGLEAWPLLVGAGWREAVARVQPSTLAFSHVIVSFRVNERAVFVDPTLLGQGGALAEMIAPPYGCGLEVRPEATGLTTLPALPPAELSLEEIFDLESRAGSSRVQQKLRATAWLADDLRAWFAREGAGAFLQARVEALQRQFPALTAGPDGATVQDDATDNAIEWQAQHALPSWVGPGQPASGGFHYGAHGLLLALDILEGPEQRRQPWALRFPMKLHHRVVVRGGCVRKSNPETHRVTGPGFRYSCLVRSARREVTFDYTWETTAREVPAESWRDYCRDREKAFAVAGANVATSRTRFRLPWFVAVIVGVVALNAARVFDSPSPSRRTPVDVQTVQRQMRAAIDAAGRGEYERAGQLLPPLDPHYRESMDYRLLEAEIALATGRLDQARTAIDQARAMQPMNVTADVLEGTLHERRGDLARARSFYEKVLAASPSDARVQFKLVPVLEQLGDTVAARQALEKILAAHPAHPDAVLQYALLLWRSGERQQADAAIVGVVRAQPVAGANLEGALSEYFANTGRHAESIGPAKRAAELAPSDPRQVFGYTMALVRSGDPGAAFDFVKPKAGTMAHPQVWRGLAIAAAAIRQRPEAEKAFQAWLTATPRDPEAHASYGYFLLQTERAPEARTLLEKGVRDFPGHGLMWLNYSVALRALGDSGAAAARGKADALMPPSQRNTLVR